MSLRCPNTGGLSRHGTRNKVPLREIASKAREVVQGLNVLNALRSNQQSKAVAKVNDGFDDCP